MIVNVSRPLRVAGALALAPLVVRWLVRPARAAMERARGGGPPAWGRVCVCVCVRGWVEVWLGIGRAVDRRGGPAEGRKGRDS